MADKSLRGKLADAFGAASVDIVDDGFEAAGKLATASAARLADIALGVTREHDEQRGRTRPADKSWIADTEITVIDRIVTALDGIDDGESAGQARGPLWRVLAYLAARYGYVLATED